MAAFADDFADGEQDDAPGPLLPPEDRLWRHPSEAALLEASTVRTRWLANEPSRASAWSAGLVGALLAAGLVALGIHLVAAIPSGSGATSQLASVTTTPPAIRALPKAVGMSTALVRSIHHVGAAVVVIEAANTSTRLHFLGLVISKDGTVLAPALDLASATSVLVTLPGSKVPDVGHLMGIDSASGIAVLHINGVSDLATVTLTGQALDASTLALAITAPKGTAYAVGDIRAPDVAATTGVFSFVDAVATDLQAADAPLGSPLLDANGSVAGIIVGRDRTGSLVTPSWMASPIAKQLALTGSVRHGWLGIEGSTTNTAAEPAGVEVLGVTPRSAGAEAGLRAGDVIVSINDQPVDSMAALQGRLYILAPQMRVTLGIQRAGHRSSIELALDYEAA